MDTSEGYTTLISFCTGIRGLERGIERVIPNLRTICCVEREAVLIENLVKEMEAGMVASCPIWPDVTNFPAEHFRGMVDILSGGYPCQGESTAGKRLGEDDPRWLWSHFARAIDIIQPRICFFENTRGHVTKGLPTVISSLESMGYRVHWGIFSAEETGATHKRERVFILGVLADTRHVRHGGQQYQSEEQQKECAEELLRGGQLADSNHNGERTRSSEVHGEGQEIEESEQRQERNEVLRQRSGAESCNPCIVGNTTEQRLPLSRQRRFWELQTEEGKRIYNRPEQSSKHELDYPKSPSSFRLAIGTKSEYAVIGKSGELADSDSNGGEQNSESSELRTERVKQPSFYCWRNITSEAIEITKRTVARPGQPQHSWESPRTVITEHAARLLGGYSKKYPESFQKWQVDQVAFDEFAGKVKPEVGVSVDGYDYREDFLRALGNSVYADTAELAFRTLLKKHGIEI